MPNKENTIALFNQGILPTLATCTSFFLAVLKLIGKLDCSWLAVASPLLLLAGIYVLLFLIVAVVMFGGYFIGKNKRK